MDGDLAAITGRAAGWCSGNLKVIEAKKFLVALTGPSVATPRSTTPIVSQRPSRPPQPNSVRGRSRRGVDAGQIRITSVQPLKLAATRKRESPPKGFRPLGFALRSLVVQPRRAGQGQDRGKHRNEGVVRHLTSRCRPAPNANS